MEEALAYPLPDEWTSHMFLLPCARRYIKEKEKKKAKKWKQP